MFFFKLVLLFLCTNFLFFSRNYLIKKRLQVFEFSILFFSCNVFLLLLISCFNLFNFYLIVEGIGLCSYSLLSTGVKSIGITESAVKYFFLGSFASGILLFGIVIIYSFIGNLHFTNIR